MPEPTAALEVVQPQKQQISRIASPDPFEVRTINEAMDLCDRLAKSGMVPKQYIGKPEAILASWIHGKELGVSLMQALSGISNINGTPAVFGDLGWALVQNHPDFVDSMEEVTDTYAICTIKRRGRSDKTWKYTLDMAKVAGLLGKDNWKNNPKRMLQWRARSWSMRDQFPDALKGMPIYEEAQDYVDGRPSDPLEVKAEPVDPMEESISREQAAYLWKQAKENSKTLDDYRIALKNFGGVEKSTDLKRKHLEDLLKWARTPVNMDAEPPAEAEEEKF